jgi:hypothetical protein
MMKIVAKAIIDSLHQDGLGLGSEKIYVPVTVSIVASYHNHL